MTPPSFPLKWKKWKKIGSTSSSACWQLVTDTIRAITENTSATVGSFIIVPPAVKRSHGTKRKKDEKQRRKKKPKKKAKQRKEKRCRRRPGSDEGRLYFRDFWSRSARKSRPSIRASDPISARMRRAFFDTRFLPRASHARRPFVGDVRPISLLPLAASFFKTVLWIVEIKMQPFMPLALLRTGMKEQMRYFLVSFCKRLSRYRTVKNRICLF